LDHLSSKYLISWHLVRKSSTDEIAFVGTNYQGTFTFDFYDLNGNLTSEVKGDLNAKRITVD